MKIHLLSGGLANQIRHYVFVRFAERYRPRDAWFFDDSFFFMESVHNGYELEKVFGIHLNLLSLYYSKTLWDEIIERRKHGVILPQYLLEHRTNIVVFEGKHSPYQAPFSGKIIRAKGEHLGFHPEYIDLPYENTYYHADWAGRKWFDTYAEENRRELQFPPLNDKQNLSYAEQIGKSYSVGIHVRRGDFQAVGWDLPAEVYKPACLQVLEEHPDAHFFIISDDLDWCRENKKKLGFSLARQTTYVEGNTGKNSYIDMQLLSMCKGMVRNAESSFSQVAGWLNPNLEFEIKIKPESGYLVKTVTM